MEYRIEKKEAFTVIANCRTFDNENSMKQIPLFWDEHMAEGKCAVVRGEYGICIETDNASDTFEYLIADPYVEGMEVPEGFITTTIPALEWAIFPCVGPLPDTLQKTTIRIYQEWLPTMKEYEISAGYGVEVYSDVTEYENGTKDEKYHSEVWLPVRKKRITPDATGKTCRIL